ncbi:hypothetical protein PHYSODRAFT_471135, partial [Phytophthora sojae]
TEARICPVSSFCRVKALKNIFVEPLKNVGATQLDTIQDIGLELELRNITERLHMTVYLRDTRIATEQLYQKQSSYLPS